VRLISTSLPGSSRALSGIARGSCARRARLPCRLRRGLHSHVEGVLYGLATLFQPVSCSARRAVGPAPTLFLRKASFPKQMVKPPREAACVETTRSRERWTACYSDRSGTSLSRGQDLPFLVPGRQYAPKRQPRVEVHILGPPAAGVFGSCTHSVHTVETYSVWRGQ